MIDYPRLRASVEKLALACGWVPKDIATPTKIISTRDLKALPLSAFLEYRIEQYIDACPPAIAGQGGHDRLFSVAFALTQGFALDADTAIKFICRCYNPDCKPTWALREIKHKVDDALSVGRDKPRGYLLAGKSEAPTPLPDDTPSRIQTAFEARVKKLAGYKSQGSNRRSS